MEESAVTRDQETVLEMGLFLTVCSEMIVFMDLMVLPLLEAVLTQVPVVITLATLPSMNMGTESGNFLAKQKCSVTLT